ncbi:hypothetical protein ACWJJH_03595 [Endozoicomonadaceae bacterium StTr2]
MPQSGKVSSSTPTQLHASTPVAPQEQVPQGKWQQRRVGRILSGIANFFLHPHRSLKSAFAKLFKRKVKPVPDTEPVLQSTRPESSRPPGSFSRPSSAASFHPDVFPPTFVPRKRSVDQASTTSSGSQDLSLQQSLQPDSRRSSVRSESLESRPPSQIELELDSVSEPDGILPTPVFPTSDDITPPPTFQPVSAQTGTLPPKPSTPEPSTPELSTPEPRATVQTSNTVTPRQNPTPTLRSVEIKLPNDTTPRTLSLPLTDDASELEAHILGQLGDDWEGLQLTFGGMPVNAEAFKEMLQAHPDGVPQLEGTDPTASVSPVQHYDQQSNYRDARLTLPGSASPLDVILPLTGSDADLDTALQQQLGERWNGLQLSIGGMVFSAAELREQILAHGGVPHLTAIPVNPQPIAPTPTLVPDTHNTPVTPRPETLSALANPTARTDTTTKAQLTPGFNNISGNHCFANAGLKQLITGLTLEDVDTLKNNARVLARQKSPEEAVNLAKEKARAEGVQEDQIRHEVALAETASPYKAAVTHAFAELAEAVLLVRQGLGQEDVVQHAHARFFEAAKAFGQSDENGSDVYEKLFPVNGHQPQQDPEEMMTTLSDFMGLNRFYQKFELSKSTTSLDGKMSREKREDSTAYLAMEVHGQTLPQCFMGKEERMEGTEAIKWDDNSYRDSDVRESYGYKDPSSLQRVKVQSKVFTWDLYGRSRRLTDEGRALLKDLQPVFNLPLLNLSTGKHESHPFRIQSIVVHGGGESANSGHYVTLEQHDGKWFLHNDSVVTALKGNVHDYFAEHKNAVPYLIAMDRVK